MDDRYKTMDHLTKRTATPVRGSWMRVLSVMTWVVVMGLWARPTIAQEDTSAFQFFVLLESGIHPDTVLAFLADLNADEIWEADEADLALWEVNSFPFTTGDGQEILTINDAILKARQKTKIRDATFNVKIQSAIGEIQDTLTCFEPDSLAMAQGISPIKITILDTGISPISDNTTTDYNYDLSTYTGYDYVREDANPDDEQGHGSFIAGLIHSIVHRITGTMGTRITFDIRKTHDAEGRALMSTLVRALDDALDAGTDIINMSFSYTDIYEDTAFFPLKVMIQEALEENVLVVCAAGNDGSDNDISSATALPASFPLSNIISIGSMACDTSPSAFSNYGAASVDIFALGERLPGPDLASGIRYASGTSHATAIVTATAALLGTYQTAFHAGQVKCALLANAAHRLQLADFCMSEGLLNFSQAFQSGSNCTFTSSCNQDFTGINALTGVVVTNKMIETDLSMESSQLLSGSHLHITYDAGAGVTLEPGFELQSGQFQILTNGCTK